MRYLAVLLFPVALMAQQGVRMPDLPAGVPMPTNTPDAVFTLPSPTSYHLPQSIKNMIMFGLNSEYNKQRSAQWREEYKYIFENKDELRRWLRNPVLNETLKGYAMEERGGIAGMQLATQRMEMVSGWMEFLKTQSW